MNPLARRVVTKRDTERGDSFHQYALEWKWACSVCGKLYEKQTDAQLCCLEKKDHTGRPWLEEIKRERGLLK